MSEVEESAPATAATGLEKEEPAAKRVRHSLGPKRKVALLVAYNGSAYQGLQRNTNAKTIEDVLEAAMHAAGAISDDNVGTLQKIAWSKAGRTDKGVHAAGQVISCKLILQAAGGGAGSYGEGLGDGGDEQAALAGTMAAINAHLERACSDVRVLRLERVTNSFCAHTGCSSREYEYLLPAYCLRPPHATVLGEEGAAGAHDPALAASEPPSSESASVAAQGQAASAEHPSPLGRGDSDPLDATELARVNAALGMLEGTHYFHNFTDVRGLSGAKDKSAQRFILSARAGAQRSLGGVAYVSLLYHGQSFMLHQIRKMTSMVAAAVTGALDTGGDAGPAMPATPMAGTGGAAEGGACEESPSGLSAAALAALSHALSAPRVPPIPKAPSCALVLRRCWYRQYEARKPDGRPSVEFAQAEGDRAAFVEASVLPHIVERERAGEFRTMQRDVARYGRRRNVEEGNGKGGGGEELEEEL